MNNEKLRLSSVYGQFGLPSNTIEILSKYTSKIQDYLSKRLNGKILVKIISDSDICVLCVSIKYNGALYKSSIDFLSIGHLIIQDTTLLAQELETDYLEHIINLYRKEGWKDAK